MFCPHLVICSFTRILPFSKHTFASSESKVSKQTRTAMSIARDVAQVQAHVRWFAQHGGACMCQLWWCDWWGWVGLPMAIQSKGALNLLYQSLFFWKGKKGAQDIWLTPQKHENDTLGRQLLCAYPACLTIPYEFAHDPFCAGLGCLNSTYRGPQTHSQPFASTSASRVKVQNIDSLVLIFLGGKPFYLQLDHFCLQLSFFACSPLRPLWEALSHCKWKSSNCKQKSWSCQL